jgi:glycosyltransferase involved in cell wall biosynthesis
MASHADPECEISRGPRVHPAPRVSVVIPAYQPQWLEEALASVRDQRFPDYEIIVVDDGSPQPVAPEKRDDLVLARQPNAGPGGARNRGVTLARGEWVAFLDADDRWRPDKLARQVDFHTHRPRLVLSCTELAVLGQDEPINRRARVRRDLAAEVIPFERLFYENCIATSSVMVPRAVWARTPGMPAQRRLGEDYLQWLRLALLGEVGYLGEVLAERREHPASLSRTSYRRGDWIAQERALYEEFLAEHPELRRRPFVRRTLARLDFQSGYFHLSQSNFRRARWDLARSLWGRPTDPYAWLNLARSLLRVAPRQDG